MTGTDFPFGGTPSDRDVDTLDRLIETCDMAADLIARGRDAYDDDQALRLASEAVLNRLGEGLGRLSDDTVDAVGDDVPTVMIRAMRNRVVHEDQRINYDIVWTTMARDMPSVRAVLVETVGRLRGSR